MGKSEYNAQLKKARALVQSKKGKQFSERLKNDTIERLIPDDLEVDLETQDLNGEEGVSKINAKSAFKTLKDDLTKLKQVLRCIGE